MKYDIALDMHHLLVSEFQTPGMLKEYQDFHSIDMSPFRHINTLGNQPKLIAQAETFYVTSAMMSKLEEAHDKLTDIEVHAHKLITEHGFVMFERPWRVEGKPYHHMSWMTQKQNKTGNPGVSVQFWTDRKSSEFASFFSHPGSKTEGRFSLEMSFFLPFGSHFIENVDTSPWGRMAEAFWLMCMNPLGRVTGAPASRKARRRAKRLPKAGEINIIYLRKEVSRDPELKEVVSDYLGPNRRHRVRSHYRRYWCGTGENRHLEWRRIPEHERGTGKLIETDRMFVLKR